ncbi:DUF2871 domain-containing protein [Vagococcus coleopterorum]|uniref:DUF2871 domain-containing protein n=2 Tax=Vagococcus coleopterorum TaxID=2714946 RepID=A0A6G8APZ7_9ENTE|nr:DUF2871 domain-containing protein [Vagococcus coleopterorum]
MNKLFKTSSFYLILGLILGVFYREFTKFNNFEGSTQLSITHTHTLVLGMMMFLIVLLLEKNFNLSQFKQFNTFYLTYNIGLLLSITMMIVHGVLTVLGKDGGAVMPEAAISGMAGLGHIIMTAGLAFLFHTISKAVKLASK